MKYKLENGGIIELQKGKIIPKLLQKIRIKQFDKAAEKAFKSSVPDVVQTNIEAGKIGWAPSQISNLWHNSNADLSVLGTTFPAWDVAERGAPLGHVWLSGSETTSGFLAKRPYRLIAKDVTIRKPLVQIGEAIGDGKNVTRNQILDFAQKSSSDGMRFSGIADNQLQNQNIYALFKDVPITGRIAIGSRPISEAEKLGIPKVERGLFDWDKIPDLVPRFNKWAQYYGYDTVPESASLIDAVDIMKNTFKRHNTFFRGVHEPSAIEDITRLENLFGRGYNIEDAYPYIATHGRPGDGAVFVSPLSNAGIYGSTGKTAVVRRKYKLGSDPSKWLQEADFDIEYGGTPDAIERAKSKGTLTFPWHERGNGIVENELLAPDGILDFIEYVPEQVPNSYFDLNGSLNKYLGRKFEMYSGRPYYFEELVSKPKFKQGGTINRFKNHLKR